MGVDRISSLPNDALQHILSYLPTKTAAQTSLLSKRWRYLWVYTPALDFDIYIPHEGYGNQDRLGMTSAQHAISRHKSSTSLRRFRLFAKGYGGSHYRQGMGVYQFVKKLITSPVTRKVQELNLSLWVYGISGLIPHKLPNGIFSFGNLRVLELTNCEINTDIGTIDLARLETLSLDNVHAADEVFNLIICSCCKSIKKLKMEDCCGFSGLEFRLQEIREIAVVHCSDLRKIALDSPNLQHVEFRHWGDEEKFSQFSLNSTDLKIGIVRIDTFTDDDGALETFKDIVCGLGLAKFLKITSLDVLVPQSFFENGPSLYGVKKMEIDIAHYPSSVVGILNLFPNLQESIFECGNMGLAYEDEVEEDDEYEHHFSIYCLRHTLRAIELRNFKGLDNQIKLALFLVKNAMVLEGMSLTECNGPLKKFLEINIQLESMKACKIAKITLS